MDEEFIFQVTEEELAQFPEEGNQSQEEQNQPESKQELEIKDKAIQESTEKQDKQDNKVKIPSLLDLKLPRLYAASRNGRWKQGHKCREEEKKRKQQEKGMPIQPPTQKWSCQTTKMETTLLSSQIGKKMRQEMIML